MKFLFTIVSLLLFNYSLFSQCLYDVEEYSVRLKTWVLMTQEDTLAFDESHEKIGIKLFKQDGFYAFYTMFYGDNGCVDQSSNVNFLLEDGTVIQTGNWYKPMCGREAVIKSMFFTQEELEDCETDGKFKSMQILNLNKLLKSPIQAIEFIGVHKNVILEPYNPNYFIDRLTCVEYF